MRTVNMNGKKPMAVSERTKQIGDTCKRWEWVEPNVWTERMLATLENGVKGEKWFSLIDKVYRKQNLYAAVKKVSKNRGSSGVDHVTIKQFLNGLEANINYLHAALRSETYHAQKIRRIHIPKGNGKETRPLGIPTIRDRVVQTALQQVIEPIFENEFAEHSYGFRPRRSCKDALREVDRGFKQGYEYVVDVDIRQYFDNIPHEKLMELVEQKITDGRILRLVRSFLKQGILEGVKEWTPLGGTPQGGVVSPLLSNVYLNPLDHLMETQGYRMIRYADDSVILCQSKQEAEKALTIVREWMYTAGLELHPDKTRIVDMKQAGSGFDFLGYHFERSRHKRKINRWPSTKSMQRFKDKIRLLTKRCNGHSFDEIITRSNPIITGWMEYFKHSNESTFRTLDSWIRMRIRSILRKRSGRRGRGRGYDHCRWTNNFFAERGLFSLTVANVFACQSSLR